MTLSPLRSRLLCGLNQFFQPGKDPAAGVVDGSEGHPEVAGHLLAGKPVDRCSPESLQGEVAPLLANLFAGPFKQAIPPLSLPARVWSRRRWALLQQPLGRHVAAAAQTVLLGHPPVG